MVASKLFYFVLLYKIAWGNFLQFVSIYFCIFLYAKGALLDFVYNWIDCCLMPLLVCQREAVLEIFGMFTVDSCNLVIGDEADLILDDMVDWFCCCATLFNTIHSAWNHKMSMNWLVHCHQLSEQMCSIQVFDWTNNQNGTSSLKQLFLISFQVA